MSSAVIYLRISDDRTGEEAGVTRQREDCERRCRDRDWTIMAVESDNDASAAGRKKRPGFEALLAHIAEGRVQVVVAWALDRLQRNRRDEVRLYELCERMGVTVSLVRGPDLEWVTPTGRYLADNLGSLARLEIEQKADRQKRATEQAVAAGKWRGGRRPFGFEADGVTVREVEAAAIREGYKLVQHGFPLGALARQWNAAGLRTGQSNRATGTPSLWRADAVRHVLRSPRYAGLRSHRGEVRGQAEWPALVSEDVWRATVDLLDDPRRRNAPGGGRALLTGLGRCGVCGATVHGGRTRTGDRTYRCSASVGHVARRAEPVEQYVERVALGRLLAPDAATLLAPSSAGEDVGALRAEAAALRVRMDTAAVDYADGLLSRSQLRAMTERLRERLADVERRLIAAGRTDPLAAVLGADDVRAAWSALDADRRRGVLDLLLVVTLHPPGRGSRTFRPESVGIAWRSADD